jgi:CRISPR-associated protein Csd1
MGQKCQITSFNQAAFRSFGKSQTANAPLCYVCAAGATQALDYLIREPSHNVVVSRDDTSGRRNPLRNHLAVFWLRVPQRYQSNGTEFDLERALAALLREEPQTKPSPPPPELAQLEAFLRLPWTGKESAMRLDTNSFHLAVLSANKGRLMVRDWVSSPLDELHASLGAFLQALRIVAPDGVTVRSFPIPTLTSHLNSSDANHIRGLLRSAYRGTPPQEGLLQASMVQFRNPTLLDEPHKLHVVAAILKLVLTYAKEESKRMEKLDPNRDAPAYACGRLLAILEDAQRRASGGQLSTTLVERYYGSASTMPAATLGSLVSLAERAHLPKIRKERRGYARMRAMLEEVMGQFGKADRLPRTLSLAQQAEFALGFYHQRAAFSAERASGARQSREGGNA